MPPFMDNTMNKISRMSRKHLIKFDNDATSCYDRALVSLGALASRAFGMSKNVTMAWAKTIEEAKYKLKLNASVSEEHYSHFNITPIHGIGQGLSNGPCPWLLISSISLDQCNKRAHGAMFETPDKSLSIQMYLVGFVDDANGNINSFTKNVQTPIQELLHKMQHDAQLWHNLLWNSGGASELPKCFCQILHWEFNNGKPLLMGKSDSKLKVDSTNGDPDTSKRKTPHSLRKTLGQHISAGTNKNTQSKTLMDTVREHHQFLKSQPLTNCEAWTHYFAVWLPSATFPTPNYWISRKDVEKVQSIAMPTLFSKCGFNRNAKRTMCADHGNWVDVRSETSMQNKDLVL